MMAMRATARGMLDEVPLKIDPRPDQDLPQDDVVMLLVTRDTWERARALGQAYGHAPAELFCFALKVLQEKAEAAGLVPAAPKHP